MVHKDSNGFIDQSVPAFLNEFLNQGIPDKLKRHVSATIKKLEKKSSADPFIVTSVNIEKLQKEVSEQFKLHVKTDRTFDTLSKGDGLDRVLQQLGLPNIIEQELVTIRQPYVGNILTQRLILKYSGLGSIRLGSNKGDLTAERIHKEIAISDTLKSSKHSEIISLVATGTPMEYRMTARRIYREKLYSQDILDVVAKRIWLDKTFKDKFAVDGMSWLIKSIGASANPRYRTLLKRLSKEAKSRKVKSWAKKAQKTLLKADAPQFEI